MNSAILALEDGSIFEGRSFGAPTESCGEVVFNTAITGYQEVFTDPSYAGQIVVLTNPHIGNYGVMPEDSESGRPYIEGLVVREFSPIASNWRSQQQAQEFLAEANIPVAAEIDTRRLVRHLRTRGVMRGVLATGPRDPQELVEKARSIPSMAGLDLASRVSTREAYQWEKGLERRLPSEPPDRPAEPRWHVVAYDFGIKRNILRRLVHSGCRVTVVPALTPAEDVLALKPDGVFLSNGPGDPEPLHTQQANVRKLIGKVPIFGICLGHQVLAIALGAKTYKLKFGHRGANHPVLNKLTGKVEITSHNHGFAVDPDSLNPSDVELTHVNLNDQTVEGFRHRREPAFCVQYHPEAAPGPHDSLYLFDDFTKMMAEFKK
ncbi:MAG TPA: glutamine-hydrolyzing carbamoyl-phosphate synthase small subunit [Bryobacteraceae bacterium]|nr:glutamine-hydrolyzing carbamoyl-phosphate synthase small subunit [Bryobacteraceae bacterium]HOL70848.1 glutamine-hydrolyzing carbamoyl-phosphate synthase small subunit [Bryobacteraceae bacterium]HOQ47364.1 glutamine-hydrolyzing carbamoyl-phosphate synthase small subunit [Bryobacteraceae bacterium]HPQ13668.1 glutamine-hydrolyzing carbamoyl-phosphate synthase small subunit [Bryobacteraceae bacterium]HPU73487.1 glutamine-hydrolyzing carbamoyl-phosphate synthase small subunit [Bryobacteraceae ba